MTAWGSALAISRAGSASASVPRRAGDRDQAVYDRPTLWQRAAEPVYGNARDDFCGVVSGAPDGRGIANQVSLSGEVVTAGRAES